MIKSPEAAQWSRAPQMTRFLPKRRCKDAPLCPLPAVRGTPLLHILLRNPLLLLLFLFVSSLSFLHSLPLVLFSFLIFFSFPLPPLLAIRVPPSLGSTFCLTYTSSSSLPPLLHPLPLSHLFPFPCYSSPPLSIPTAILSPSHPPPTPTSSSRYPLPSSPSLPLPLPTLRVSAPVLASFKISDDPQVSSRRPTVIGAFCSDKRALDVNGDDGRVSVACIGVCFVWLCSRSI